jgi:hypothetical protein
MYGKQSHGTEAIQFPNVNVMGFGPTRPIDLHLGRKYIKWVVLAPSGAGSSGQTIWGCLSLALLGPNRRAPFDSPRFHYRQLSGGAEISNVLPRASDWTPPDLSKSNPESDEALPRAFYPGPVPACLSAAPAKHLDSQATTPFFFSLWERRKRFINNP